MNEANDIAAAQGWNDDTLRRLAMTFIETEGLSIKFVNYLRDVQDEENSASGLDQWAEELDPIDFGV